MLFDTLTSNMRNEKFSVMFRLPASEGVRMQHACTASVSSSGAEGKPQQINALCTVSDNFFCLGVNEQTLLVWPLAVIRRTSLKARPIEGDREPLLRLAIDVGLDEPLLLAFGEIDVVKLERAIADCVTAASRSAIARDQEYQVWRSEREGTVSFFCFVLFV